MRTMRKVERQMTREEACDLLARGEYGVLATVDRENQPYGVPLSYALVGNCIYFHGATVGHKLDNIAYNSNASFTVVGATKVLEDKFSTEYESVIVFGRVELLAGNEKITGLREIIKKYSLEYLSAGEEYIRNAVEKTAVFKLNIDDFSGKHRK